jgi:glyoxylase-like metal-dependent hydrolase (beta-lactamase superfamily II)/rhodanese-related sulfurtransferase
MVHVEVIATDELGDRSYIAHDGQTAVVIDPQRDIDRVEAVLQEHSLTCAVVVETHIHNDYVTGGYVLASQKGARYVLSAADTVSFEHLAVNDGDTLQAGSMTISVVATPGHTDTHLAYVIRDESQDPPALFTGGSLLFGSVGRTDLVAKERTEELTRAQFHSARRLAELLPDETAIYPTHGFGSFCSSGAATGGDASTLGEQRRINDALTEEDEDTFVERLIANLTAYPAYYAYMAPLNRQGPQLPDLSAPTHVDAEQLRASIEAGEWVVDLRQRKAFAAAHLEGSIGIELGGQFATYLGWLIPWGSPLTIVGPSAQEITDVQRQLVRIGIDHLKGAAVGDPDTLKGQSALSSYRVATFDELPATVLETAMAGVREQREHGHHHIRDGATTSSGHDHSHDHGHDHGHEDGHAHHGESAGGDQDVVLDVRRLDERAHGAIPGSVHVPLSDLLTRLESLPEGRLWVHCASGFRASIAASLLDRAGREVVLLDDDYSAAVGKDLATG